MVQHCRRHQKEWNEVLCFKSRFFNLYLGDKSIDDGRNRSTWRRSMNPSILCNPTDKLSDFLFCCCWKRIDVSTFCKLILFFYYWQKLHQARQMMDRLRACIVAHFYSSAGQQKMFQVKQVPTLKSVVKGFPI